MRTTININFDLLKRLKVAADDLKISTNEIITMLIQTVISKDILDVSMFNGVKYQKRDTKKNWRKFHVSFEHQIYEKGLDLRRFFKLSVSFIISFAIEEFLDEIIEDVMNSKKTQQKMDNYPLNYTFIANTFNNIQGFIIFWGIPEEKYLNNLIS